MATRPMAATVPDALTQTAREHPDRAAFVHGERRITYRELAGSVEAAAAGFRARGVRRGSVVVVTLASSIDFVIAVVAAMRIGAIATAINPRLGPAERDSILHRTNPALVVDTPALLEAANSAATAADAGPGPDSDDLACIVWTSGTTGDPKGATYGYPELVAITNMMGDLTHPDDVRIVALPFAHVGFMTRLHDEFTNATTTVIATEPWRAVEYLAAIERERVTVATGVPTQWRLILDHPDLPNTDTSSLRLAGIGAAAIDPALVAEMRAALGVPVMARYASTEAGLGTGTRLDDPPDVVATTVGRPPAGVELRIAAPDDRGVGEILLRSPARTRGYWRDPDRTAAVIDGDGFLHTGDLGFVGDDGNLRIVGRLTEMYIRGGYNVYPAEVEHVLTGHPAVAQAAVVAWADPVLGEIGVACVVADASGPEPDLDDLRAWCHEHLADYKAPDRLAVLDALPVTAMGKVDKRRLTEMLPSRSVSSPTA